MRAANPGSASHSAAMFSLLQPRTSARPRPPTPIPAMFSVSLGACTPRPPSTRRGTIINEAADAEAAATNRRREICLATPFLLSDDVRPATRFCVATNRFGIIMNQ